MASVSTAVRLAAGGDVINFIMRQENLDYVSAVEFLAKRAGITLPDFDAKNGEGLREGPSRTRILQMNVEAAKYFRNIETTTLAEVSKRSGQIISTGGGCVTTEENYNLLRQNSTVFWLKRDIDSLPKDGRPLSKSVNLEDMYNLRKPLYERFCDYIIDNNDSPEKTVQKIKECLE